MARPGHARRRSAAVRARIAEAPVRPRGAPRCRCAWSVPRRRPDRRRRPDARRSCGSSARTRSSTGSGSTPRSASASPTWPATGPPTHLADLLTPFAARLSTLIPPAAAAAARGATSRPASRARSATRVEGSRENIHRHYDLSNELFELFLDETMTYSAAWFDGRRQPATWTISPPPSAARSTAAGPGRRAGRAARAGDRHRLGRAGHPGRAARRPGDHADHLRRAAARWPSSGCAEAGVADRVQVLLRDYREARRQLRRRGQRRDDRGGRRASTGRPTSPRWTGCSRRAAGRRCSRSPCRTTGCWPPATTTPGSHKYIFPGGLIPSVRGDRAADRAATACGSPSGAASARTTRDAARTGSELRRSAGTRWPRSASTRRSAGCGSSTWPTARPGSASGYLDVHQFALQRR